MEKADNVYIKCIDIGWSDLGTWGSLYEYSQVDEDRNCSINGKIFSYNNHGCILSVSPDKVAVIQGLNDYIVVESNEALLIVRRDDEQNIKLYLEDIKKETKKKYL